MEASSWTFSDNGDSDTSADSSDEDREQHASAPGPRSRVHRTSSSDAASASSTAMMMLAATNQDAIPWLQFLMIAQTQVDVGCAMCMRSMRSIHNVSPLQAMESSALRVNVTSSPSNHTTTAKPAAIFIGDVQASDLHKLFDDDHMMQMLRQLPPQSPEVTVQAHCTALAYFLGVRDERGVGFVEREKLVACLVDRMMPDGEIASLLAIVDEWADGEMVNVQQALHILRTPEFLHLPGDFASSAAFRSAQISRCRLLPSEIDYLADSSGPDDFSGRLARYLAANQLPPSRFEVPGIARLAQEFAVRRALLGQWIDAQRFAHVLFPSTPTDVNADASETDPTLLDCIARLTPSSSAETADRLLDGQPSTYWESCKAASYFAGGPDDRHAILIRTRPRMIPLRLDIAVNPDDASYMPKAIRVLAGNRRRHLRLVTSDTVPRSTHGYHTVTLDLSAPVRFVQLTIVECYETGFDTRIRGLRLRGVRAASAFDQPMNLHVRDAIEARRLEQSWIVSAQLMAAKPKHYPEMIEFTLESFGAMKPMSLSSSVSQPIFSERQRASLRRIAQEVSTDATRSRACRSDALRCLIRLAYAESSVQEMVDLARRFRDGQFAHVDQDVVQAELAQISRELAERLDALLHRLACSEAQRLPIRASQCKEGDMLSWSLRLPSGQPFLCTGIELIAATTSAAIATTSSTRTNVRPLIESVEIADERDVEMHSFSLCRFSRRGAPSQFAFHVRGQIAGEYFRFRTHPAYGIVAYGIPCYFAAMPPARVERDGNADRLSIESLEISDRMLPSRSIPVPTAVATLLSDAVRMQRLTSQLQSASCEVHKFDHSHLTTVFELCRRIVDEEEDLQMKANCLELLSGAIVSCDREDLADTVLQWLLDESGKKDDFIVTIVNRVITDGCEYLFGSNERRRTILLQHLQQQNEELLDAPRRPAPSPLLDAMCRHFTGGRSRLIEWPRLSQIVDLLDVPGAAGLEITETANVFRLLVGNGRHMRGPTGGLLTMKLFELVLWINEMREKATGSRKSDIHGYVQQMATAVLQELLLALHDFFGVFHTRVDIRDLRWLNELTLLIDVLIDELLAIAGGRIDDLRTINELHFACEALMKQVDRIVAMMPAMRTTGDDDHDGEDDVLVKLAEWPVSVTEEKLIGESKCIRWRFQCLGADVFALRFDGGHRRLQANDLMRIGDRYGTTQSLDATKLNETADSQERRRSRDRQHTADQIGSRDLAALGDRLLIESRHAITVTFQRKRTGGKNGDDVIAASSFTGGKSSVLALTVIAYRRRTNVADCTPAIHTVAARLLAMLANSTANERMSAILSNTVIEKFVNATTTTGDGQLAAGEVHLREHLVELLRPSQSVVRASPLIASCARVVASPLLIDQSTAISRRSVAVLVAIAWNVGEARRAACQALDSGDERDGENTQRESETAALVDAYRRAVQCSHRLTARRQQIARESNGATKWTGCDLEPLQDVVQVLLREIDAPLSGADRPAAALETLVTDVTVDWTRLHDACVGAALRRHLAESIVNTVVGVFAAGSSASAKGESREEHDGKFNADAKQLLQLQFVADFVEIFQGTSQHPANARLFEAVQAFATRQADRRNERFAAICAVFCGSRLNALRDVEIDFLLRLIQDSDCKSDRSSPSEHATTPAPANFDDEILEVYNIAAVMLKNPDVFAATTAANANRRRRTATRMRRDAEANLFDSNPELDGELPVDAPIVYVEPGASTDETSARRIAHVRLAYGSRLGLPPSTHRCAVCSHNLEPSVVIYRCLVCTDVSICPACFALSATPPLPHCRSHPLLTINYGCNRCGGLIVGARWSRPAEDRGDDGDDDYDICTGCRRVEAFPACTSRVQFSDEHVERARMEQLVEFPATIVRSRDAAEMDTSRYLRALSRFVLPLALEAAREAKRQMPEGILEQLMERMEKADSPNCEATALLFRYVDEKEAFMRFLRRLYAFLDRGVATRREEFALLAVFIKTIARAVNTRKITWKDVDTLVSPLELADAYGVQFVWYLFGFARQSLELMKPAVAACIGLLIHQQLINCEQFKTVFVECLQGKIADEGEDRDCALLLAVGWPIAQFPGSPVRFRNPRNLLVPGTIVEMDGEGKTGVGVVDKQRRPFCLPPQSVQSPALGPIGYEWADLTGDSLVLDLPVDFRDRRTGLEGVDCEEGIRVAGVAAQATGYSTACTTAVIEWAYQCLLATGESNLRRVFAHVASKLSMATVTMQGTANVDDARLIFMPNDYPIFASFDRELSGKSSKSMSAFADCQALEIGLFLNCLEMILTKGYLIDPLHGAYWDRGVIADSTSADPYIPPSGQRPISHWDHDEGGHPAIDIDRPLPYAMVATSNEVFDRTALNLLLYETTVLFRAGIEPSAIYAEVRKRLERTLAILYARRFLGNLLARGDLKWLRRESGQPVFTVRRLLRLIDMLGMNLETRSLIPAIFDRLAELCEACSENPRQDRLWSTMLLEAFELLRLAAPRMIAVYRQTSTSNAAGQSPPIPSRIFACREFVEASGTRVLVERLSYVDAVQISKWETPTSDSPDRSCPTWNKKWECGRAFPITLIDDCTGMKLIRQFVAGCFDTGVAVIEHVFAISRDQPEQVDDAFAEFLAGPAWKHMAAVVERTIAHAHDEQRVQALFHLLTQVTTLIRPQQKVDFTAIDRLWQFAHAILDTRQGLQETGLTPSICRCLVQWIAAVQLMVRRCASEREMIQVLSPTVDERRHLIAQFTRTIRTVLNIERAIAGRPLIPDDIWPFPMQTRGVPPGRPAAIAPRALFEGILTDDSASLTTNSDGDDSSNESTHADSLRSSPSDDIWNSASEEQL